MERCTVYMDNNIVCANISVDTIYLPQISDCDILTASESFYHMDRTADFNVMIYVTDGVMYVTENGIDHEISAGELLFLKSGLRHFGKYETQRGTRWFYAHFDLHEASESSIEVPKKSYGLSESVHEEKIFTLHKCFHDQDPFKRSLANGIFYDLLTGLALEKRSVQENLTDRICAFLDSAVSEPFSKELVRQHFFLSYSHTAAEFKRYKGMSMGQYHNLARMKKACYLLRSTIMSVSEIAEALGFADMLYFSRKFHEFSGMSPTDYRKKAQQDY